MSDAIFPFGTLRLPDVQLALFHRLVPTRDDVLPGHVIDTLTITDLEVIRLSGTDRHPALRATGRPADVVDGVVLEVTPEELAAADRYEQAAYRRVRAVLASGNDAWIYLPKTTR